MTKGSHHTKETRQKLSLINKGNTTLVKFQFKKGHPAPNTAFKKGNRPWNIKGHHSSASRLKMSNSHKGKILSEEHKINIGLAGIGRRTSDQTKQRISLYRRGLPNPKIRSINNGNYKGGISPESNLIRRSIEGKKWIRDVFIRDDFTCQKTKKRGRGNLIAHHIFNFSSNPELRFVLSNGITLSQKSHDEFHKKYGKINNTKEQLDEFLNN